jgi:hypothetical protein
MIGLNMDHFDVVRDGLNGTKAIDEQTLASLEVLNDRLESVRKLGGKFASVAFSPDAESLMKQSSRLAVGQG